MRRIVSPFLALGVAAGSLSACGDDVGTGTDTAATGVSTTASTAGTGTASTSAGSSSAGSVSETGTSTSESGTGTSAGTSTGTTTVGTTGTSSGTDVSTSGVDSTSTTMQVGTTDGTTTDQTTGPPPCPEDTLLCENNVAKVCDGMGGFKSQDTCANVCVEPLGCVLCAPGTAKCDGDKVQICDDMGKGYVDTDTCDALLGLACDADQGACVGPCANLGLSYIGCEYYPVVTQQLDPYAQGSNPYAVAVANASADAANVTIHRGANLVKQQMVPANSVSVINLPWVVELYGGTGPSKLVVDGAYRLRSTRPVTVYQFNPLNADVTNDASLLLPVNTWTGNYLTAAWPFWASYPGFISITARQDNTKVTVKAPKSGVATQPGGGIDNLGNGVVTLNEGDVLQITAANGGDPTGTIVTADKPVQVLGGHDCTQVPIGTAACDHLEESMFPIEALAKEYIVVPPVQVPNNALEKAVVVRIVASEDNTTLTYDPDQPVAKTLAKAGDFIQIPNTTAKFQVKADKKILVAEYMVGQSAGFGTSDPAMLIAVPAEQFRTSYLFYAQTAWQANFVDIIAPTGANVQVDGAPAGAFAPIGNSGFGLAHVKLSNAGNGSHTVSSDKKVGISVYGVVSYGSYWYPGGLDLDVIPQ